MSTQEILSFEKFKKFMVITISFFESSAYGLILEAKRVNAKLNSMYVYEVYNYFYRNSITVFFEYLFFKEILSKFISQIEFLDDHSYLSMMYADR